MEILLEKYLTMDNILFMLKAAGVSVGIAALALTLGLCLGILGAAGRISKNKLAHGLATFYVENIRGTPMMLQILFFYLGVPSIVRSITGTPFNPSVYLIGIVALSINSGAYTTELIRSAIQAVDNGQWEPHPGPGLRPDDALHHSAPGIQTHYSATGQRVHHPHQGFLAALHHWRCGTAPERQNHRYLHLQLCAAAADGIGGLPGSHTYDFPLLLEAGGKDGTQ